jgi:hypothetical protein
MRDRRDWHEIQSTHARVLEALEAAIAAHPASGRRAGRRSDESASADAQHAAPAGDARRLTVVPDPAIYADDAVVVPFSPRVVTLVPRTSPSPDDDGPAAA